jgi:hypothetical protein
MGKRMTSSQGPDRGHTLLEAVAFAAERLLGPPDQVRMSEVLLVLGRAAGASRVALVAASDASAGLPPRMEVRHQWTAVGVERVQPASTGWHRYPVRWQRELEVGTTIAGPARAFPPGERAVLEAAGCRTIMLVPVVVGDRWYGHLEIGDATERTWTAHELESLRAAAGIVGSGIAHRQALGTLERRGAILAAAGGATSLLLEATHWRAALPRVLDDLRTATRTRSAWAYGPDPGRPGRRATLLYEVIAPGARPAGGHPRILELSPEATSLLEQGHHVHDRLPGAGAGADPGAGGAHADPMREALMLRGVASWVMVPLDIEAGGLGVVGLDSELPRAWGEGEVEGLHVLAGALRAAIRRGGTLVSVPIVATPWGRSAMPSAPAAASTPVVPDALDPRNASAAPAAEPAVELPVPLDAPRNPD